LAGQWEKKDLYSSSLLELYSMDSASQ